MSSHQSTLSYPVKKRSSSRVSLLKDSENCEPLVKSPGVKRVLFDCPKTVVSPKKVRASDENSIIQQRTESQSSPKHVFHVGIPSRLIGRSSEIGQISEFLTDHIQNKKAGSMYISGAPGTGKTSSLVHILKMAQSEFTSAFINCMSLNNSSTVYKTIASKLGLSTKATNSKNIVKLLEKHIVKSKVMNVLVLDEIDQLDSKGQEVLYSLFEWPRLPKSSLILIGIANALDLTDRILPRLHAFKFQPQLLHFQPYSNEQIASILQDRLSDIEKDGRMVIKPIAIQLCARKIAASTGDIRKALDVCRRAIELVENRKKQQVTLKQASSDDRCNPGSPLKRTLFTQGEVVDIQDISKVLHEIYGSRLQTSSLSSDNGTVTLPLQQVILICTLILLKKASKNADVTMGRLYDVYKQVCKKRSISEVGECEFQSLCKLVELRGFIQLKNNKVARMSKVVLKIDEGEAEHVLQDKALLPAILADPSVICGK